jgi:hypothetical protein
MLSGLYWALKHCSAAEYLPRKKEEKDPFETIKEFLVEAGRSPQMITSSTLKRAGVSPKRLGPSKQIIHNGKNVRVHDISGISAEVKKKNEENRRAETAKAEANRIAAASIELGEAVEALRSILWDACYPSVSSFRKDDTEPIRGPAERTYSELTYRVMCILEGVR